MNKFITNFFLAFSCWVLLIPVVRADTGAEIADSVFQNGRVYSVNSNNPWAKTVAIKDGQIIYVGDESGIKRFIGSDTVRHNLDGKLLLPGFIDTHAHPILAAASMNLLTFEAGDGLDQIFKKLKKYAKANKELPLIMGFGFSHGIFDGNPTREMLDAIIPDRPVFLVDNGGHMGWANSRAFEVAGVDEQTPDPVPGSHYYVRDESGRPLGYMFEEGTFTPFAQLGAANAKAEIRDNSEELFLLMSSFGITSVFDASMEWFLSEGMTVLSDLENKAALPLRFVTSMTVERSDSPEHSLDKFKAMQAEFSSDQLRLGAVKVSFDGTLEGGSAALLNNYLHGGRGALNWTPEAYRPLFVGLDKAGIDIHIHAIGDRAVNSALNAIEFVRQANGFTGTRHTICHTQLIQDSDIPRFKALEVIAQTTPIWHAEAPGLRWNEIAEAERQKLFPFKSLAQTGAHVTFGSDFPYGGGIEALVPAYNIEVGHTRVWPGNTGAEPLPRADEKLSVETLIHGYTLDAAYQLRMEDKIGSIEVGKRADLIVLDRNIFDIPSDQLHRFKVELTMVDGKVVYTRPFYQWAIEWWLGL